MFQSRRLPIGIIPARAASSRFPRKVLAPILDKPMIQHTWEAAKGAAKLADVLIATDDITVEFVAKQFRAKTVMTPASLSSGSDRVAFVAKDVDASIVVNLQADEPLVNPQDIDRLVVALEENPEASLATLAVRCESRENLANPNVVKVVFTKNGDALYFSRHPLASGPSGVFYKHIGIYAYRRDALLRFCDMPRSPLETAENLEQLRALENGMKIKIVVTETDTIAVDVPEDIEKVEERMRSR